MAGLFLPFLLTGRSFVWVADARTQYYPQMVYLRRYLQELFSGLVHGDPGFRFYDLTIGMGEGIIVAARLHRLDALSALVPLDKVGVFYSLVIVLRLYLAGLAFSAFCHYKKLDRRAVMIGVIVYLSGDFATYRVTCHPFFAAALYMLPLMLRHGARPESPPPDGQVRDPSPPGPFSGYRRSRRHIFYCRKPGSP